MQKSSSVGPNVRFLGDDDNQLIATHNIIMTNKLGLAIF